MMQDDGQDGTHDSEHDNVAIEGRHLPISHFFDLKRDAAGKAHIETWVRGIGLLRFVLLNKGSAFSLEERRELGLEGLLPPRVSTMQEQMARAYKQYLEHPTPLSKYQFLRGLQERQEVLFHALVKAHLEEMMPIVYTPTVGEAIEKFSALFQSPRGLTVHEGNIDRLEQIVAEYPMYDVRVLVVTDSSAILGIGDQGYGGMGICIGKLTLYTVGGGVSPFHTMPVGLDVGTDRSNYLADPLYLGAPHPRLRGEAYESFVDKFVEVIRKKYPNAILQWEDLASDAAFHVLQRYRKVLPSFNDDIQGTGAVTLAGIITACHLKGEKLTDQRFCVYGAGAGGVGVASVIVQGLINAGLTSEQAYSQMYVLDSRGLILDNRELQPHKAAFAHKASEVEGWTKNGTNPDLRTTIEKAKCTVLIGLSGQPGAFDQGVVEAMSRNSKRPILFALSNPTKLVEALPSDLLAWTDGNALVATGSPFAPVNLDGRRFPIGQGNNAFVFPGLGLGAMLARVSEITDTMVLAGAYAVSDYTKQHHAQFGLIYPPLTDLPKVSRLVAAAVVKQAVADGVARESVPSDPDALAEWIDDRFWEPEYLPIRAKGPGPYRQEA